ncbi:hypothetical protein [Streptomyces sp900116325]|uniref:Uncharacterized protein n=1 Tax=Streptomyces sp. 900116325 TaxID=3154295 RepID=A0ABV2UHI4_9ACTN
MAEVIGDHRNVPLPGRVTVVVTAAVPGELITTGVGEPPFVLPK